MAQLDEQVNMEPWQEELIQCDVCGGCLQPVGSGMNCVACGNRLEMKDDIIINGRVSATEPLSYYNAVEGTHLRERSQMPFTTAHYETRSYSRILRDIFPQVCEPILDLGCGDGRNIQWLLDRGFTRIVAVDFNLHGLERYRAKLSSAERSKVLFVNGDILHLPLRHGRFAAILAIEVLYYLGNRYREGCSTVGRLLQSGGLWVNADPTLEGALLYSLVQQDVAEFIRIYRDRTKTETGEGISIRPGLFTTSEMMDMLHDAGFSTEREYGIPSFPNAVIALLQRHPCPEELKGTLHDILTDLADGEIAPWRCACLVSRKTCGADETPETRKE